MARLRSLAVVVAVAVLVVASTTSAHLESPQPTALARKTASNSHPRAVRRLFGLGSGSGSDTGSDTSSQGSDSSSSSNDGLFPTSSSSDNGAASSASAATASESSAREASSEAAAASSSSAAAKSSSQAAAAASASRASLSSSAASTPTVLTSTDNSGATTVVTQTVPYSSEAASSTATSDTSEDNSSNHTPLIIGVSVVGGVAILGAIIFLWMKFGGKRFSDYKDDDADIKWPELKADHDAALQPLPARRTGGAGFDMGGESDNGHEAGGDSHSMQEYGGKGRDSFTGSSVALNAYPNSSQAGGYYDPYGATPYVPDPQSQQQAGYNSSYGHADVYGQMQDPYMGAAPVQHTSPSMDPYRVNVHQGQPMQNPYA